MTSLKTLVAAAAILLTPIAASAATVNTTLSFDGADSVFQVVSDRGAQNVVSTFHSCTTGRCMGIRSGEGGGESVTLSRRDGGTFSVTSLWFALLGGGLNANALEITLSDGTTTQFSVADYATHTGYIAALDTGLITSLTFRNLNKSGMRIDDIAVSYDLAPVPLPATGLLLLAGLGGFAALRRRMRG